MSTNSILTPSCDFFTDMIFQYWQLTDIGNNLYVSMCVMGPINFNQSLLANNTVLSDTM